MKVFYQKILFPVFVFAIILSLLSSCANIKGSKSMSQVKSGKELGFQKILFPGTGEETCINDETKISYNTDNLRKELDINQINSYYSPVKKDRTELIKELGFNPDEFTCGPEDKLNRKLYRNMDAFIDMDEYGSFLYTTGKLNMPQEMTVSVEECKEKAVQFLKQYNLLDDSLEMIETVDENHTISSMGEYLNGVGIKFRTRPIDGIYITGNRFVTVFFDSMGEITEVHYRVRDYEKSEPVKLISYDDAIKDIKTNSLYEMDSLSKNLKINHVYLQYYEIMNDPDKLYRIPIYTFTGVSTTTDDREEIFSVSVNAVEFD